jgi:hypothetical protein
MGIMAMLGIAYEVTNEKKTERQRVDECTHKPLELRTDQEGDMERGDLHVEHDLRARPLIPDRMEVPEDLELGGNAFRGWGYVPECLHG